MTLPLRPPIAPALARSRRELPIGQEYAYEIKLDGFRCIAFVDGRSLELQSRGAKPLQRYFPELRFPPGSYVLDGEIVVRRPASPDEHSPARHASGRQQSGGPQSGGPQSGGRQSGGQQWDGQESGGGEDFDALQQRIHPARSRVELLAEQTPATYVAFDLLAHQDQSLLERPFSERRAALERLLALPAFARAPVRLMPSTDDPARARAWLRDAEGAIAKLRSAPYQPGKRTGMFKVKRVRTIDAIVAGWRPGKEPDTVGALILALYDGPKLRVVGHCSGLTAADKRRLVSFLAPYQTGERGSADPSRWSSGRELEWVALRPELVVEIDFDHVSAGRIRHGARLRRWREDKRARECTYDQLHQ